jgi:hypothetical protein
VNSVNVFSFGGGVQSTAAIILAAQGKIDYRLFVFANTGNDSEDPETLEYVRNVSMPYARQNGIELVEVSKSGMTLLELIYSDRRTIPIPARLGETLAPANRSCTVDYKILVVDNYCKAQGLNRVSVGMGITVDEFYRAKTSEWYKADNGIEKQRLYPLIDLRLSRHHCIKIIQDAGLRIPPKSACWFCPYASAGDWLRMKYNRPELFAKAVEVERQLNSKGLSSKVRLHRSGHTLDIAVGNQLPMFSDDNCEDGYCMV